jgi:hypothetical protein
VHEYDLLVRLAAYGLNLRKTEGGSQEISAPTDSLGRSGFNRHIHLWFYPLAAGESFSIAGRLQLFPNAALLPPQRLDQQSRRLTFGLDSRIREVLQFSSRLIESGSVSFRRIS